jgi:hypothetical protein
MENTGTFGWMPPGMTKKMGRGAPKLVGRTVKACKRCKQAKHKCDDSRPCRRCLFMGKQAECLADWGQQGSGIEGGSPVPAEGSQSLLEGQRASRPAGRVESAGVAAHAGAGPADGDEDLVAAVPGMEVVSLSPALARRYRLPFGDLVGTNLLVWVVEDGHEELLAAIASVIAGPTSKCVELVGKMYVQRRTLTEIHQCTLRVKSCGSDRVAVRIAWGDSMRLWEDATTATGSLPLPVASCVQRAMRLNLQGAVFSFDELQSRMCVSEYAKASMARTGSSPTFKIIIDKLMSLGAIGAKVMQWQGLRAMGAFAARMVQASYEIEETAPASTQPSTAIIHVKFRMKLPDMLSGASTPWVTVVRLALNGELSQSTMADESYSVTIRLDPSIVDVHAGGPQHLPFAVSLLRFRPVADAARGQRLELVERHSLTWTSEHISVMTVLLPADVAAKAGAEQARSTRQPHTSMESLIMSAQPWTGQFVFARRDWVL